MDKLFKGKRSIKDDFKFDESTANVFDDMIGRSVPFYAEIQRMISEIAEVFIQNKSNVYDLGCSTGTTLLNLAKNINKRNVKFRGIDYSDAMLEKARIKLGKFGMLKSCVLMNSDLNKNFKINNASVVIMSLTLQFIRPLDRDLIISEIYRGLKKNGCLIIVEKIISPDSKLRRLFIDFYYDYKMRKGYSELEISKKRMALENVLIPYTYNENTKLLKKNGFKVIDEFFRWYNFCGVIAVKR